ncbi:platelet-activating factor acetylhydrolase [Xylariaceae sp. FL0255]|nr:platelet-activating factor acetylhydrolase [Xylariaceae sp. FL0255]
MLGFDSVFQNTYFGRAISCILNKLPNLNARAFPVLMQTLSNILPLASAIGSMILVPDITGPYKVGTTVLELIDFSRQDPYAPTSQPRSLVVSLFYPTHDCVASNGDYKLAPQFPPQTAKILDKTYNAPGVAENIFTRSYLNAPLAQPELPFLLYGPGLGTPRLFYSDFAADLASYGWNVITVDHPYDSPFVEYPDGRLVLASESPNVDNATMEDLLYTRVADISFVLDSMANSTIVSSIPGLNSTTKLQTHSAGVFGHSFGGATALQVMSNDTRFKAGADLDGAIYGSVVEGGTDRPFLMFGRPDHNETTDPTWAAVWPNIRGLKRLYAVNGTGHYSYSDLPGFRDILGRFFPPSLEKNLGSMNGSRIMDIERAFLEALFSRYLKGSGGELLDGKGLEMWPEVTLRMA